LLLVVVAEAALVLILHSLVAAVVAVVSELP